MLTGAAKRERWWSGFPALQVLLGAKKLQVDELKSSIQETYIESLSRLLTYAALVTQEREAILFRASYTSHVTCHAMRDELREMGESVRQALSCLREQQANIEDLTQRLASDGLRDSSVVIARFAKRMQELLDRLDAKEATTWRRELGQMAESASLVVDQSYIDFSSNNGFVASLLTDNCYALDWMNVRLENRFPDPDTREDVSQLASALGC